MFAVVGELEKLLQSLDALQLAESGKELRERRKCSVTEIQVRACLTFFIGSLFIGIFKGLCINLQAEKNCI